MFCFWYTHITGTYTEDRQFGTRGGCMPNRSSILLKLFSNLGSAMSVMRIRPSKMRPKFMVTSSKQISQRAIGIRPTKPSWDFNGSPQIAQMPNSFSRD